ncbi:Zn-ribbon domain-containing OB-fold protein [Halomarina ordinaria]|uniref:Zn-ribbon domain-containing OB-fold protein n=1 Tax=Halomarina ordinaria TaxID=3033939 RepID=A0ABD5U6Y0_9EURY|nr:OB-fold domain-containing protein [Halomarina sp. PSRA2]
MSGDERDGEAGGSERVRDAGFDDLLDAIEAGEGHYLRCSNDHGSLPPRRVCPHCGDRDLTERPLPDSGTVSTYTVVAVPTPQFADDAPYVTAVVDFGTVRLTGVVDADPEAVETGMTVGVTVGTSETTGDRLVRFVPR